MRSCVSATAVSGSRLTAGETGVPPAATLAANRNSSDRKAVMPLLGHSRIATASATTMVLGTMRQGRMMTMTTINQKLGTEASDTGMEMMRGRRRILRLSLPRNRYLTSARLQLRHELHGGGHRFRIPSIVSSFTLFIELTSLSEAAPRMLRLTSVQGPRRFCHCDVCACLSTKLGQ